MPLSKGKSRESIGKNIKAEEEAGKKKSQAVAIALNTAREAGADIPKAPKKHARRAASGPLVNARSISAAPKITSSRTPPKKRR